MWRTNYCSCFVLFVPILSAVMRTKQKLQPRGRVSHSDLHRLSPGEHRKGRGAVSNPTGRFETQSRESFDDGWENERDALDEASLINWHREAARTIITKNASPDISFDRSINPYRGCEHGCVYCFARPSHAYLGHSAGVDFERQLYFKHNAVDLLRKELSARSYKAKPIALGVNTDCYQPEERRLRLTRELLKTLSDFNHPVVILTKSALIRRDIDILSDMAERQLVSVGVSVTSLKPDLCRKMEPRAASAPLRIKTIRDLSAAGIPVTIMTAPIIPCLNDMELEHLLLAGRKAGARSARYVLLRLPYELKDIFHEWLTVHYPDRTTRVINALREMRGGKDYDADWHTRQRGEGIYADLIAERFQKAVSRLGYTQSAAPLRSDLFRPPAKDDSQFAFEF